MRGKPNTSPVLAKEVVLIRPLQSNFCFMAIPMIQLVETALPL